MAATNNNMNFDVNLLPTTTGDHNLGSSDKKWNLYVNNINGAAPLIGVKGSAENSYRTGNVEITKSNIGLGNVENTALSTWAGTSNITTLGTITTGTWNGTTIAVANGGTGATSVANIQAGKDGDGNTISSTYLKLAGGTLTSSLTINNGAVYLKNSTLDITSATNALSTAQYIGPHIQDKNGTWIGAFRTIAYTDGSAAINLAVRNYLSSDSKMHETTVLTCRFYKDGTVDCSTGAPVAWRNALGASSGIWPVSLGGTGATSFTSGYALIGAGTDAITTRAITNNTTAGSNPTANSNLITANTLMNYKGTTNITTIGPISGDVSISGSLYLKSTATGSNVTTRTIFFGATNQSSYTDGTKTYTIYPNEWVNIRGRNRYKTVENDTTTWTAARFEVRQYSAVSSSGTRTSYYDAYAFPVPADDKTANNTYTILTTKSAVAVTQGGTGSTTKDGALSNLGIKYKTVSGTTGSGNGTISLALGNSSNATKYYVISVQCVNTGLDVTPYYSVSNDSWYARCSKVADMSPATSTSVTLKVVYIEFSSNI